MAGQVPETSSEEAIYSLGAVVKLTGLSSHTIRAWERRHQAVRPIRTPGGTRRYTRSDVRRLRLLREGIEAGHRIGALAQLSDAAIEERVAPLRSEARPPVEEIRDAVERLDPGELERLLALQCSVLGPLAFARDVAAPLLREVGERWEAGTLSVAAEHLASATVRGLLGAALRSAPRGFGPSLVFTTPVGERHELGALIAAVVATSAGARVTYLGPDLPVEEVVRAVGSVGARAVGLSVVNRNGEPVRSYLAQLRRLLADDVSIWVGGRGHPERSQELAVEVVADLGELERRVSDLARESAGQHG